MSMDKETPVLDFTSSNLEIVVDLPELKPKVMTFECVDPRKCKAMRKYSNLKGIKEGELFPYKTPGGLNNLLSSTEAVKGECFEFLKLGYEYGAKEVWLVAHTCCAADKKKFGDMTSEQDISEQEKKLLRSTHKILEFSNEYEMGLIVRPIFFQIIGKKAHIYTLGHAFVPSDNLARKKSVLMETASLAAVVTV